MAHLRRSLLVVLAAVLLCGSATGVATADSTVNTPETLIKKDKVGDVHRETKKRYSRAKRGSVDIRRVAIRVQWDEEDNYVGSSVEVTMRAKKRGFAKRDKPAWRWGIAVDLTPINAVGTAWNPQVSVLIRSGRKASITRWTVDGQKTCRVPVTRSNRGRTYRVKVPDRCLWNKVERVDVHSWMDPIWQTDTSQLSDHLKTTSVLGQYPEG